MSTLPDWGLMARSVFTLSTKHQAHIDAYPASELPVLVPKARLERAQAEHQLAIAAMQDDIQELHALAALLKNERDGWKDKSARHEASFKSKLQLIQDQATLERETFEGPFMTQLQAAQAQGVELSCHLKDAQQALQQCTQQLSDRDALIAQLRVREQGSDSTLRRCQTQLQARDRSILNLRSQLSALQFRAQESEARLGALQQWCHGLQQCVTPEQLQQHKELLTALLEGNDCSQGKGSTRAASGNLGSSTRAVGPCLEGAKQTRGQVQVQSDGVCGDLPYVCVDAEAKEEVQQQGPTNSAQMRKRQGQEEKVEQEEEVQQGSPSSGGSSTADSARMHNRQGQEEKAGQQHRAQQPAVSRGSSCQAPSSSQVSATRLKAKGSEAACDTTHREQQPGSSKFSCQAPSSKHQPASSTCVPSLVFETASVPQPCKRSSQLSVAVQSGRVPSQKEVLQAYYQRVAAYDAVKHAQEEAEEAALAAKAAMDMRAEYVSRVMAVMAEHGNKAEEAALAAKAEMDRRAAHASKAVVSVAECGNEAAAVVACQAQGTAGQGVKEQRHRRSEGGAARATAAAAGGDGMVVVQVVGASAAAAAAPGAKDSSRKVVRCNNGAGASRTRAACC